MKDWLKLLCEHNARIIVHTVTGQTFEGTAYCVSDDGTALKFVDHSDDKRMNFAIANIVYFYEIK